MRRTVLFLTMALMPGLAIAAPARDPWLVEQNRLFRALKAAKAIDGGRKLWAMNQVCNLHVGKHIWKVIDTFEVTDAHGYAPGRGISQIILLDRNWHMVKSFTRLPDTRPLFCRHDTIYLANNDFDAYNGEAPGNSIRVAPDLSVTVSTTASNDMPMPVTSQRHNFELP